MQIEISTAKGKQVTRLGWLTPGDGDRMIELASVDILETGLMITSGGPAQQHDGSTESPQSLIRRIGSIAMTHRDTLLRVECLGGTTVLHLPGRHPAITFEA
ncbi:hypothetical protein GCM10009625_08390 [Brachybacterium fresconis]